MLKLGPLGQSPHVALYTILTLGFAVKDESHQGAIISVLEKAAIEITISYPWLAGQIVNEKSEDEGEPSSGTFKIVNYRPHEQPSRFIHVKDCRSLCPSYADFIKARAPMSMLDGSIISPAYGYPYWYPSAVTQPVVILQANFIRGGLLLTSCGHHLAMDANGHEQFVWQFARLCRGEKLLKEHVLMGNADQQTIIPPLPLGQEPSSMEMCRCSSKLNDQPGPWPPVGSGATWRLFRFTAVKIATLKIEASRDCSSLSIPYVSSNDVVTAFIWTHFAILRSKILPKESVTMLIRAVNGRKRLIPPLSEGYMGNCVSGSFTRIPLSTILEDSLSKTTIKVRKSLVELDNHHFRSLFSLLKSVKDKTTVSGAANYNPATDLVVTSLTGQQLYSTNFGDLLGLPDFIRRPRIPDWQGSCYLMPITRDGDIDATFGLSEEEYAGLKADARWMEFAEFIE